MRCWLYNYDNVDHERWTDERTGGQQMDDDASNQFRHEITYGYRHTNTHSLSLTQNTEIIDTSFVALQL